MFTDILEYFYYTRVIHNYFQIYLILIIENLLFKTLTYSIYNYL